MPSVLSFPNKDGQCKIFSKTTTHAVMELYGTIGTDFFGDGVSAKDVVEQIKSLPESIKTLDLHINSPGGSVTEGMAIYNRLKQYGQKVEITAHIDALSASIASVIMLSAKNIKMGETGFIMIHKPWSYAVGNADDLEKTIQILEDIETQMVSLYAKKSGLSRAEIQDLLKKETWMDVDMAKSLGFIDEKIEEDVKVAACALDKAKWLGALPNKVVTRDTVAKQKLEEIQKKMDLFLKK